MACRVRVEEVCLDDELYSVSTASQFTKLVLCYPTCSSKVFYERQRAVLNMGVTHFINYGGRLIKGYRVLGKGYSSITALALHDGVIRAVKVRRIDSRRTSLELEAVFLEYLGPLSLAPRVYAWTRDFIVMEYVGGTPLDEYVSSEVARGNIVEARRTLSKALVKAYLLDLTGVDHGELNRPRSHVMVFKDDVVFIDFESASCSRKTINFTSLASHFLIRSSLSRRIVCKSYDFEKILARLRQYSQLRDLHAVKEVLELLEC